MTASPVSRFFDRIRPAAPATPDQPAGDSRPPSDDAEPEQIAALAGQLRAEATEHRDAAASARAEAEAIVRKARQEAARMIADAETRQCDMGQEASRLERHASSAAERAGWLANAAAEQERAITAERRADDLEDERDRLGDEIAELDMAIGRARRDRQAADQQRSSAAVARDREAISAALLLIATIDEEIRAAEVQQSAAQARVDAIGNADGPGELSTALVAGSRARAAVASILNAAFPERPEAVAAAAAKEFQLIVEANIERIVEESGRAGTGQPRRVVHL
jgi:hypothetical protein